MMICCSHCCHVELRQGVRVLEPRITFKIKRGYRIAVPRPADLSEHRGFNVQRSVGRERYRSVYSTLRKTSELNGPINA